MDEQLNWPADEVRTLWLRHGWHNDPRMMAQLCAWTEANGLDPAQVSGNDPYVVGRSATASLRDGPTLTVTEIVEEVVEVSMGSHVRLMPGRTARVRRTVPLKVAPPEDLFLDVAAEVQRAAAGNPEFAAWVAERMAPAAGPGSPLAGERAGVRGSGRAEPSGEAVRRAELDTQLAAIAAGDLASFEASAKAVGYDAAVAELRGVVERTGSPAARWAADYLAASSVRSAALGDAR